MAVSVLGSGGVESGRKERERERERRERQRGRRTANIFKPAYLYGYYCYYPVQ
jgi:hypothetical protein